MAKDDIVGIEVDSGVSGFDGKPFVNLILERENGEKESGQFRPGKAREIAVMLFEGAVEAERDASLVSGVKEKLGMGEEDAGRLLMLIREERARWEGLQ